MTKKERLKAELEKRQQQDEERRAKTRQLKEELARADRAEAQKRHRIIGRLVEEAGLMDWQDEALLNAFQEVSRQGEIAYLAKSESIEHAAD